MNKVLKIIRAILRRLGIWWEMYYIMINDIDIDNVNKKLNELSLEIPYNIVELQYSDFLKGDKEFCTPKKLNKYKKWFSDNSHKAYGIIINNELACCSWISFKDIEITNKTKLDDFYGYPLLQDVYTFKKYRKMSLHKYVNLYLLKKILDYGIKQAIVIVRTNNIPALKTQKKSDFEIISKVLLISIFGKEYIKRNNYES